MKSCFENYVIFFKKRKECSDLCELWGGRESRIFQCGVKQCEVDGCLFNCYCLHHKGSSVGKRRGR